MNTFDVYDCSVSFRTNAKTYKEAWNELVSLLESVGVEILDGTEEVLMTRKVTNYELSCLDY